MRHVLFCSRTLRFALLVPVVVLALTFASANAQAAAWTGNTGVTACTGPAIGPDTNQPGNCTWGGYGNATFAGYFIFGISGAAFTDCTPQAADDKDVICGHFGMNFSNVRGTVTVQINNSANDDLDLCVVDAANMVVGTPQVPVAGNPGTCSTQGPGATTEVVKFNVRCSDTRFEAWIIPASIGFPDPLSLDATSPYTGKVIGTSLRQCAPLDGNGEGNDYDYQTYQHHGHGDGQGEHDDHDGHEHEREHVHSDVDQNDTNHSHRGKVSYQRQGCDVRSQQIDSVDWNDATRTMVVTGLARVNGLDGVPFVFTMTDGGPGQPDTYHMESTCGGSGHMTSGDYRYSHDG